MFFKMRRQFQKSVIFEIASIYRSNVENSRYIPLLFFYRSPFPPSCDSPVEYEGEYQNPAPNDVPIEIGNMLEHVQTRRKEL